MNRNMARAVRLALIGVATAGTLSACAPLLVGGAIVGGSMVATDRRTSGAQVEDEVHVGGEHRAREAVGHGVRAKRSKSGAISFDLIGTGASDAAVQ